MVKAGQRWLYTYQGNRQFILEIMKYKTYVKGKIVQVYDDHTSRLGLVNDHWSLRASTDTVQNDANTTWSLLQGQENPQ